MPGCTLRFRFLAALVSAGLSVVAIAPAAASPASTPITIGRSIELLSKNLSERRTFNVVLPASYAKEPNRRYPVLYLIDGGIDQDLLHVAGVVHLGALWGRSSEAIVVGIETKDRRKELTGPTKDPELLKRFPTAGSSAKFREFIRSEIKPLIETTYRTNGRSVILGESLAGLFVAETYVLEPSLFNAYAAVDPSLWWDKGALSLAAANGLGSRQRGRGLFIAIAKEQSEDRGNAERLVSGMRAKGLSLCASERPDLTHATIYQQISPQAVQYLLPPAVAPPAEYGFNVNCTSKL